MQLVGVYVLEHLLFLVVWWPANQIELGGKRVLLQREPPRPVCLTAQVFIQIEDVFNERTIKILFFVNYLAFFVIVTVSASNDKIDAVAFDWLM